MAPKTMKRPAAAAAGAPAKKGRKSAADKEMQAKISTIADAVLAYEELPQSARELLSGGMPACLAVMKEERHPMQHSFVEMIAEVLTGVEAGYTKKIESYQEVVSGADAKQADLAKEEKEAEEELLKLKAATAAADETYSANAKLETEAAAELKQCKADQTTGDAEIAAVEGKKALLEALIAEVVEPGKAAALKGRDGKKQLKMLAKAATEFSFDASMIDVVEGVFQKDAAERSTFDGIVLKQLDDALAAVSAKLTTEQETLMPGKVERQTVVTAKESEFTAIAEKAAASKAELDAAKAAEEGGAKILAEKKEKVLGFLPEMKKISDAMDAARAALAGFKIGALQTFGELKELAPPPPPPEPEPVAEEPAAAEEPAPAEEPAAAAAPAAAEEPAAAEAPAAAA